MILNKFKMPRPLPIFSKSDYLIRVFFYINSHTEWQTVQIQISWLLQKPTDLDLHCLQRQGISGFSRTRVEITLFIPKKKIAGIHVAEKCQHAVQIRRVTLFSCSHSGTNKSPQRVCFHISSLLKKPVGTDVETILCVRWVGQLFHFCAITKYSHPM